MNLYECIYICFCFFVFVANSTNGLSPFKGKDRERLYRRADFVEIYLTAELKEKQREKCREWDSQEDGEGQKHLLKKSSPARVLLLLLFRPNVKQNKKSEFSIKKERMKESGFGSNTNISMEGIIDVLYFARSLDFTFFMFF